ncbi:MAG: hypothetical protein ACSNEK_08950 [Parachlamydiaceae bacterium]
MHPLTPFVFGFSPVPVKNTSPQVFKQYKSLIAFKLAGYIPIIGTIASLALALFACCQGDPAAKGLLMLRVSLTLFPVALLATDIAVTILQLNVIKRQQQNSYSRGFYS